MTEQDLSAIIPQPFQYQAVVQSVYDGDTCRLNIDLGLGIWAHNESVRLFGINAPEMRGAEKAAGRLSRDALRDWILGRSVMIRTIATPRGRDKKGKYGRYLAVIWQKNDAGVWVNVNARLVREGYAVYKDYS